MIARFNGNVVPFADDATSTNRTVFGGTTQSDLIDDNLNTNFKKGWEIVGLNDNPTREDFNAMGYTLGALTAYLYQMGIAEWNTNQAYGLNGYCVGSDGKIYRSKTASNTAHNPTLDTTNWESLDNNIFGIGQTWQDVTVSRVVGVTYTNSTGKPIQVNVTCAAVTNQNASFFINGIKTNTIVNWNSLAGGSVVASSQVIVLSGSTYQVTSVGASIESWFELR